MGSTCSHHVAASVAPSPEPAPPAPLVIPEPDGECLKRTRSDPGLQPVDRQYNGRLLCQFNAGGVVTSCASLGGGRVALLVQQNSQKQQQQKQQQQQQQLSRAASPLGPSSRSSIPGPAVSTSSRTVPQEACVPPVIQIWDPQQLQCVCTLQHHSQQDAGSSVQLFPVGSRCIASAQDNHTLLLWDTQICSCKVTLRGHSDTVACAAPLSDNRLVTGSYDKSVKVWSLESGKCLQTLCGARSAVTAVAELPGDRLAAIAADPFTLKVWDLRTGSCCFTTEVPCLLEGPEQLAALPDGRLLFCADKEVCIWDPNTPGVRTLCAFEDLGTHSIQLLPGGRALLGLGYGGLQVHAIRGWQQQSVLRTPEGSSWWNYCCTPLSDGCVVFCSGREEEEGLVQVLC